MTDIAQLHRAIPGARRTAPKSRLPRLDIRGPVLGGLLVVILFFGGGVGGAAVAPIDKGISLSGNIIVEHKAQTVQHQKGGVVGKVHVSEGQDVAIGQVLVTLDTQTLDQQIAALRAQAKAAARQLDLIRQEALTMADVADRKSAAHAKVLGLEHQLAEVEKETAGLSSRIAIAEQDLTRAEIRAPIAGRILSLAVHGAGAMIQAGATVLEIAPQTDRPVVEGRLSQIHIDDIKHGMGAKVWMTGSSWRDSRPLTAKLAWVSPDSVEDKRTGVFYFMTRIELEETRSELAKRTTLHPGQRAEVLLLTGERTLLDHLLRNFNRAFRA